MSVHNVSCRRLIHLELTGRERSGTLEYPSALSQCCVVRKQFTRSALYKLNILPLLLILNHQKLAY